MFFDDCGSCASDDDNKDDAPAKEEGGDKPAEPETEAPKEETPAA